MKNKIILITYFSIIISLSKSENYKVETLWEKTSENFKENVPKQYLLSDIENIFNENEKKKLIYELSLLYADTYIYPYAFIINNICCGDLKNDNFLIEYTDYLGNKIINNLKYSNEKETMILLLVTEPKIYKINLFGSQIKKQIKKSDLEHIYKSVNKSLKDNNYMNALIDTFSSLKWIFEINRENEQSDFEEEEENKNEEKKKENQEIDKDKDDKNKNDKNNNNSFSIVIIIILIFILIIVLFFYFKLCKKVKILSSEKIDFNPYEIK